MNDLFSAEKSLQEKAEDFARDWEIKDKSDRRELPLYQVLWIDLSDLMTGSHKDLQFEKKVADGGRVDVYSQKYGFIVEQKAPGTDLDRPEMRREVVTPFEQAKRYNDNLPAKEKVSTIVISNFDKFRFYDLDTPEGVKGEAYRECALEEIPQKLELFEKLFKVGQKPEEEWSILDAEHTEEAADDISDLYQSLLKGIEDDEDLDEEEKKKYEEDIPLIIMRIVFLLFANSTSDKLGAIFKNLEFESFLKDTDEVHLSSDLITLFK